MTASRNLHGRTSRTLGVRRVLHRVWVRGEAGMTTAEYAVGTVAACAFAAVLLTIVRSDAIRSILARVITSAIGG